jgi:predicted phage terminase large subunit-like protein
VSSTMTPAQVRKAQLQKLLAQRVLARRRLLQFTQMTHPSYSAGWVHDDICRRLEKFSQQVAERKSPRLMLLMPPRHGKSELASIRFPAWHLGHNPTHEIINVGYNLELPMKFSRKVREVMRDPQYRAIFPDTQLDPDSQSVEAWNTTKGGGFTAAGVGGGITGKGAHILIIDDPIKNQEEADSILVRDKLWDWYQSTAYTRLAPGGGVLVIETWWNDDDLAGRLQQAMSTDDSADQFEIVRYPALSEAWEYRDEDTGEILRFDEPPPALEPNQTLLRPKDTCLHEDRYPTEALKRIRANLQPRIWSALYQQNPVPDEGMYFKKEYFRYQRALPSPNGLRIYTAWDFAIGEKQQNDWTVGATVLQDETDTIYVLEIFRMKGDSFQIVEAMLDVALRWGSIPTVDYLVGAEDGQIWRAIEPLLKKRMGERRQYPPYEVMRPMTDKLARARPLQGRMQQGRVVFPEGAPWLGQAEQELLRFPAGAHDDVVDALAWAAQLCMGKEPPRVAAPPPMPSWRDKLNITSGQGSHMTA